MTAHRQHVVTVLGQPETARAIPGLAPRHRRRATDQLVRTRAVVYLDEAVELMVDGTDGTLLNPDGARELAKALLEAADVLEARTIGSRPAVEAIVDQLPPSAR